MVLVPGAEFVKEFADFVPEHFEPLPGGQEVTAWLSGSNLIDKRLAPQGCLHPRVDDRLTDGEYQCDLLLVVDDALWLEHLVEGPHLFLPAPRPILSVPMALVEVDAMHIAKK